ncbi:thiamine-monophosphate kinase [Erythromicrobium ramosum]|uniref:Thiamine-monophosphate kinase n=1 Tax=Erythrobacter ramosus TaxID=35811 RepID=A0A6I4UIQ9_9SPHN|nr:thiamine-phosphate kinase [Erythrobacter ramosus]MBB3776547.1 thiamine-monophosphate kinase [Erythrobacter ramosus]MXP38376.1 thiamine-phosphate kinase [Erythrobacter ramosus]
MNEADFIAALRDLPLHPGARGLQDDCAVLTIGGETLVITHDMMAEGTHFRPDADMADVAWKLVASNISDLAAKGAEPVGVLLGHMLGRDDARFLVGLHEALAAFGAPLLGGDTVAAQGARSFGLTAIGRATHQPVPSRSGARPGDSIYLTGPVGRAMLGFAGDAEHLTAFNRPQPRLAEGQALAPHVSAMMDVSDGLLLDSWRMGQASGVTFALETDAIPVADPSRLADCIRWGDDYELLFTAAPAVRLPVAAYRIGTVIERADAPLTLGDEPLTDPASLGYQHG